MMEYGIEPLEEMRVYPSDEPRVACRTPWIEKWSNEWTIDAGG